MFSTIDEPLTTWRLCLRLFFSFCGLGTLLVLFMPQQRQSLQDIMAKTEMIVLSKQANDHKAWR
jgi:hypothetical protein